MYIQEAIKKAMETGHGITRTSWPEEDPITLIPTNTTSGIITAGLFRKAPAYRWQPKADDLLADDWQVVG